MIQQTSITSYMNLSKNYLSKRQELILNYLKTNGSSTDREIAYALDFGDPNAVRPRRKELLDEGLICEDVVRCCAISGKMVKSWKVLEVL
jgi:predicted transcriptional regulator